MVALPGQLVAACALNPVACENLLPGAPPEEWDISGTSDHSIQGFATDISVNVGETVRFKVKTEAASYRIDIYRVGYYQGLGARLITTITPSVPLPQAQPEPISDPSTGLVDCGNWAESASWPVPPTAASGFYIGKLVRNDTAGASHILFVVRDDAGGSDLLFQMSDTTWQAYNGYGGRSLYDFLGTTNSRAFKVSYNRPFTTRDTVPWDSLFLAEYPMIRWLEANGFDVSYTTGVDTHRRGNLLLQHRAFLSVGHDEYWSGEQRANVEAARNAGVHLAFFSGNEIFWKVRWEPSIDGSGTPFRTLVCYKETKASAKIDPHPEWTGTWRDPRFSPPSDGGRPENMLSGTLFAVNGISLNSLEVPAAYGAHRFWRNTGVASLAPGQVAVFAQGTLGFEWDESPGNGPPGLMRLSLTTADELPVLQDHGNTYAAGSATHSLSLYRHSSGALVFGAGTVQWSWGLDDTHDNFMGPAADIRLQQATANLFADMGVQPATLQPGLLPATPSTDTTPPSSVVGSPASGATLEPGVPVIISGSAADLGGKVWAVEVSIDGGTNWYSATGRETWSRAWTPAISGVFSIQSRAVDDSGNLGNPSAPVAVTVSADQISIWGRVATPLVTDAGPDSPIELGVKFRSDVPGTIKGIRFFKAPLNKGPHVANLWLTNGALLASAPFSGETAAGWQQINFAAPVPIASNTVYVASYHTTKGHYSIDHEYFFASEDNPPLHALSRGESINGVYTYAAASSFPTLTYRSGNYWVDVAFETPLALKTPSLASGILETPYSLTLAAIGGKKPYAWSISSGSLPPGLNLDSSTGAITGLPTTRGHYSFTAEVSDADSASVSKPFNIAIYSAPGLTIWGRGTTPLVTDGGADSPVELGLRFRSDVDGLITGIRFYKAAANSGVHVGNLWSSTGQLLAQALFSAETASGWQQVDFDVPVAITAHGAYVASYHCPRGHYSIDLDYLSAVGVDNPPLHALVDGDSGRNGVFVYSASSAFPIYTYWAANYWVDVVFQPPLAINNAVLANGILDTPYALTLTATGGKKPHTWSISSGSLPPGLALDPSTGAITGTPTTTGDYSFSLQVSDSSNPFDTATKPFAITIFSTDGLTIWGRGTTPLVTDGGPDSPVELGVRFRSDVNGSITGIRFYKAAANTGGHIGSLWTGSGQLLASATFSSETASGWQQVDFAPPVPITANAVYVASYHCTRGHYSIDLDYFAASQNNGSLTALSDSEAGGNGVYAYSADRAFPLFSYRSANYWVDVVFQTPLTISSASLPDGLSDTAYSASVAAVGGRTPHTWAIANGSLPPGLALDPATGVISGTPTTPGTFNFTVQVSDTGNPIETATKPFTINILTKPATIWGRVATPLVTDGGADSPAQLGVKFRSDVDVMIKSIRFYKAAANTGVHVGNLWTSSGALLASVTFTSETPSGWQQADFPTPVPISANTVYVASYHCTEGHYSLDRDYFASAGVDNPPLHALADSESGGNGVYAYGGSNTFPNQTYRAGNYWVDVVFIPAAP